MDVDSALALQYIGLLVVGFFAGTINTVAGGGSLISLPALVFFGLPADVANGTNRIGVLLQSSVAAYGFRAGGALHVKNQAPLIGAACFGAILGALVSVQLEPEVIRKILGGTMLTVLVLTVIDPKRWLHGTKRKTHVALQAFGFVVIGAYGGLIQAGVGLLLVAGAVLLAGEDLVRATGLKNLITALFTIPTLGIYIAHDLVAWGPGIALAGGAFAGGRLGTKLALKLGPKFLRAVLIAVALLGSGYLLLSSGLEGK